MECKKSHADGIGLDTEETGVKGQHDQDPHYKTDEAKVSRFWVLQRQQDEGMEVQTPSGICEEVQRQAESADL